jgi:Tfp pilus assembly protein PilN
MKPVNLIPAEQRRHTSVGGRSGGGAYALLGILVLAVLVASAYALAARSVDEKRAELADKTAQADKFAADAQRLQVYTRFAQLREKRAETVASIARSRFDWARAMREVARTLPAGVTLTSLTGNVTPGVTVEGGATDPLRSASAGPAMVLAGCATGQDAVARTMVDLRRIEGVQRVALSSSAKGDSGSDSCTGGSDKRPKFSMVVFFETATAAAASGAAAATTATTTTASTGASK